MQKRILFIISLVFLLFSCESLNYLPDNSFKEVRYIIGDIHNVNKNAVTLSDNSTWLLNRFLVSPNLVRVIVVLPEDRSVGFMMVMGVKYYLKTDLSSSDLDLDFISQQNHGYLTSLNSINPTNGKMEMQGRSQWQISGYYKDVVKNWQLGSELIIPDNLTSCINLNDQSVAEIKLLSKGEKKDK